MSKSVEGGGSTRTARELLRPSQVAAWLPERLWCVRYQVLIHRPDAELTRELDEQPDETRRVQAQFGVEFLLLVQFLSPPGMTAARTSIPGSPPGVDPAPDFVSRWGAQRSSNRGTGEKPRRNQVGR
jgi:hypothetical protein